MQTPDTAPGAYYVSAQRSNANNEIKTALVSGPYDTHAQALALVTKARNIANDIKTRAPCGMRSAQRACMI